MLWLLVFDQVFGTKIKQVLYLLVHLFFQQLITSILHMGNIRCQWQNFMFWDFWEFLGFLGVFLLKNQVLRHISAVVTCVNGCIQRK